MLTHASSSFLVVFSSSTVPKWVHHLIVPIVNSLEKYIPPPYAGEIRGLASHFGGNLTDIVILNFAYEVSAYVTLSLYSKVASCRRPSSALAVTLLLYCSFCTSIITQDKSGNIYHGRNLDYPHPVLRNMTLNVIFMKNGKVQKVVKMYTLNA